MEQEGWRWCGCEVDSRQAALLPHPPQLHPDEKPGAPVVGSAETQEEKASKRLTCTSGNTTATTLGRLLASKPCSLRLVAPGPRARGLGGAPPNRMWRLVAAAGKRVLNLDWALLAAVAGWGTMRRVSGRGEAMGCGWAECSAAPLPYGVLLALLTTAPGAESLSCMSILYATHPQ